MTPEGTASPRADPTRQASAGASVFGLLEEQTQRVPVQHRVDRSPWLRAQSSWARVSAGGRSRSRKRPTRASLSRSADASAFRGGRKGEERRPSLTCDEDRDEGADRRVRESLADVLHAFSDMWLRHRGNIAMSDSHLGDRLLLAVAWAFILVSRVTQRCLRSGETQMSAGSMTVIGSRSPARGSLTSIGRRPAPTATPSRGGPAAAARRPLAGQTHPQRTGPTVQRTGADRCTDSPSMPTGTTGSSELTSTCRACARVSPRW